LGAKNRIIFKIIYLASLVLGFSVLFSCVQSQDDMRPPVAAIGMMDDSLLNFNRQVVKEESQAIADFILRYHWKMTTTQTGLRWMIYKKGKGNPARKGDIVSILYNVHLLNGDLIFSTDPLNPFKFEIGKRKVPIGLEEGVMLMKTGDKAKLIVPSHLAFGLIGDLDKVPERAILVYDVEICQIKQLN
jgi:FKBP-type peptidyl-prolyl cis-trans isomerase FkpA